MAKPRSLSIRHVARRMAPQAVILAVLGLIAAWLVDNMFDNLLRRGIAIGFDFLDRAARFPIAESILNYSPTDSFGWAIVVGIGNTLFISAITILLATVLGLPLALARRSSHPLTYSLSSVYVDVVRNTPLIVQLLFCYSLIVFGLPASSSAVNPAPGVYLTDRGLYLPHIGIAGPASAFMLVCVAGMILVALCFRRDWARRSGRRLWPIALAGSIATAALTWWSLGLSVRVQYPVLGRFNFDGGITLTPEFVAILLGLLIYSTAFTAEIIRGGIDAVGRGQFEAGRAIGLSERQTLRLVVMPQALRVIIPPMTSQYINIIKNSTLALVVGYPELNFVTATTVNQTGQAVEGVLILMATFLCISLGASWLMNRYNRRIERVER